MKRWIALIVAAWLMLRFMMHTATTTADESCTMYVHVHERTFLNSRMESFLDIINTNFSINAIMYLVLPNIS